jgi:hypothetical protein
MAPASNAENFASTTQLFLQLGSLLPIEPYCKRNRATGYILVKKLVGDPPIQHGDFCSGVQWVIMNPPAKITELLGCIG